MIRRMRRLGTVSAVALAVAGCTATIKSNAPPPPVAAVSAVGPGGFSGPPKDVTPAQTNYAAAIYVQNGRLVPAKSFPAALVAGNVTPAGASGVIIRANRKNLNGVLVRGAGSQFTLSNAKIVLTSDATNDFVGLGAGAMAEGGATLILRDDTIVTSGLIRSAVVNTGGSTLKVYNSVLVTSGGQLPPGYRFHGGPGMISPPPGLHIGGTARATLTMDRSDSYFYHTTVVSAGWAGISTDSANGHVYVEVNDSNVTVKGPGYGFYSDAGCVVVANRTRVTTRTYNAIMAGPSQLTFNDVTAKSGDDAVMIHNVMGKTSEVAKLAINGGDFVTGNQVLWIRSANAAISIDHARFHPGNGVLIESSISDDPNRTQVRGQPAPAGIDIALARDHMVGDILHLDSERAMTLTLVKSTLRGAIENATISLDGQSRWTATKNSTVVLAAGSSLGRIDALAGVTITATGAAPQTRHLRSGGTLVING